MCVGTARFGTYCDPMNPTYFNSVGVYTGVTSAHNVAINEESGYAYLTVDKGTLHEYSITLGGAHTPIRYI